MKPLKIGLLAALIGSLAFANADSLAQKIAVKVKPVKIDNVTFVVGAKAVNNKVVTKVLVNDVNNYLTYTFKHPEAVNAVKKVLRNRLIKQFCSDKHILKVLSEGVEYEVDYTRKSNNKVFLKVNVTEDTCKI